MSSQCAYPGLSSTPSHAGTDQLSPFRPRNVIVSRCVLSFGNRTIHYSDNHNKTRLAHSAPMNYGRFASSGLGVGTIQSGITAATFFFFLQNNGAFVEYTYLSTATCGGGRYKVDHSTRV
jgi:hypothetical protein